MKIVNIGSLNLDKVYDVAHFVNAAETLLSNGYAEFVGGKGLNQSIALARAGATVFHAGAVGTDGEHLLRTLTENGVDTHLIRQTQGVSGHAIIQRSDGQNCIIVHGGANAALSESDVERILSEFSEGDLLLLQNETSCVAEAIRLAKAKGMKVAWNASPITPQMQTYPLEQVDCFLVNEVEAAALAQTTQSDHVAVLERLSARFSNSVIVMTVGADGAYYRDRNTVIFCEAYRTAVVDTTAAGDTFAAYFLAALAQGKAKEVAMRQANAAAALAIGREGACNSIPHMAEVQNFLHECATNGMGG